ncbi:MAG: hypothetical protein EOL97_06655 [Spirochaetia bacterium]|nr:hypothetical protein [Spirochaetia bacterium]
MERKKKKKDFWFICKLWFQTNHKFIGGILLGLIPFASLALAKRKSIEPNDGLELHEELSRELFEELRRSQDEAGDGIRASKASVERCRQLISKYLD